MKKILILNGSLTGKSGNTEHLITELRKHFKNRSTSCEVVELNDFMDKKISLPELKEKLQEAHGFIFTSGTYWDSWGSPMQYFLEATTEFEASDVFVGKSAAVLITMHAVGGKGVLSRLQGVLNTQGLLIPPMSGMVYSLAQQLALTTESTFAEDFWSLEDTEIIVHNLLVSLNQQTDYKTWPVDHKDPKRIWIK